jgi:hypothetical protein
VIGPDGTPVPGARVALHQVLPRWPILGQPVREIIADGKGEFALDASAAAGGMITARAEGLVSEALPASTPLSRLPIQLVRAFDVTGLVLDRNGSPVADCEVVMEPGPWGFRLGTSVRTGPRGLFRFEDVRPGQVRLTARDARFAPVTRHGVTVGSAQRLSLQFQDPSLTLTGRVVLAGDQDRGIGGARVHAFPHGSASPTAVPMEVATDDDGNFTLAGLGPSRLLVEVFHADYSTTMRVVDLDVVTPTTVLLPVVPKAQVAGRLLGDKAANAEVRFRTRGERGMARADADGRFVFPDLHSVGPGVLELGDQGLRFERSGQREVAIEVGGDGEAYQISVATPVRGVVVDGDESPIAGVLVFAEREQAEGQVFEAPLAVSGPSGAFECYPAHAATARLVLRHPDFAMKRIPAAELANGKPVRMLQSCTVTGHVTRDGDPVPGALVFVEADGAMLATASTGLQGEFVLGGLPPGEHQLQASYSTMSPAALERPVQALPGQRLGPFEIAMPPVRLLEGIVVDGNGEPVPDVLVLLAGGSGGAVPTDQHGRFALETPEGVFDLHVFARDLNAEKTRRIAPGDSHVRIELDIIPFGRVRATVRALPGNKPVLQGVVRIEALDQPAAPHVDRDYAWQREPSRWVVMPEGVLDIAHFPAGTSRLILHCPGYAPFVRRVEVEPGRTTPLPDIYLEPGSVVRGVVQDEAGQPVLGARVYCGSEQDLYGVREWPGGYAGLRGQFEISGVSSVSRSLVVSAPGYATRTVDLQLPRDVLRADPLLVTVTRGADIQVKVVDEDGRPRSGGIVLLSRSVGNRFATLEHGRLDGGGRYVFRHRAPGLYSLVAWGTKARRTIEVIEEGTFIVLLQTAARD